MSPVPAVTARPLRVCLVAHARYPVCEPFAGGLEAMTFHLAAELVRRGHEVSLFAAPGSDPALDVRELPVVGPAQPRTARLDTDAPPGVEMLEHHAYLALMLDLAAHGSRRFDVVHNNSLHHLPVAMAPALGDLPVITTLHTPPLWWLRSAIELDGGRSRFVAVSEHTAQAWASTVHCEVVHNGVDLTRWPAGDGGGPAVWSGRITPEKAPHEAIDAARLAGVPLVLAGPVMDEDYHRRMVVPRLGGSVRHLGHLDQQELAGLLGRATVALVTPAWDEPYGLVAAEAMACGTPVAAYARGALPEVLDDRSGRLARPGDPADLARALLEARELDRAGVRAAAHERTSLTRMVDDYERLYRGACLQGVAA
ncbi:glycosyltransferase family 4 protein [Nocardioides nanhaiensis]|uniref:Glycosyltransferase family 4 protein n=1 Tax=Nocardioides nanhaiensis TaxID=1476871 RepID=A0ABP8VW78_9ACTN